MKAYIKLGIRTESDSLIMYHLLEDAGRWKRFHLAFVKTVILDYFTFLFYFFRLVIASGS